MSTTLDDPITHQDQSHATRLQAETTAVRLHIRWPGTRKSLNRDQKQQAAGAFDTMNQIRSFRHELPLHCPGGVQV
jgi:hypothetical protein